MNITELDTAYEELVWKVQNYFYDSEEEIEEVGDRLMDISKILYGESRVESVSIMVRRMLRVYRNRSDLEQAFGYLEAKLPQKEEFKTEDDILEAVDSLRDTALALHDEAEGKRQQRLLQIIAYLSGLREVL